jgi:type IV secretory pathway VirJ component
MSIGVYLHPPISSVYRCNTQKKPASIPVESTIRNILLLLYKIMVIGTIFSYPSLYAQTLQPTRKLPIIERRSEGENDFYIIFLTGNGGWKDLAQSVTSYLNSKNVSVVAINTKKYLWSEKEPAQIACDLETLMDRFNDKWGQTKVVLLGYSMGAEVLPFAVNCMEEKYRNALSDIIMIGPWQKATFKVNLLDYVMEVNKGTDIYTELLKMKTKMAYVICDDNDISICHKGLDGVIDHDLLGGGHHFGGDYASLSELIGKRLNLE